MPQLYLKMVPILNLKNYLDLTKKSSIYISDGIIPKKIKKLPRIGISKAMDKKWNFSIMSKDYF